MQSEQVRQLCKMQCKMIVQNAISSVICQVEFDCAKCNVQITHPLVLVLTRAYMLTGGSALALALKHTGSYLYTHTPTSTPTHARVHACIHAYTYAPAYAHTRSHLCSHTQPRFWSFWALAEKSEFKNTSRINSTVCGK